MPLETLRKTTPNFDGGRSASEDRTRLNWRASPPRLMEVPTIESLARRRGDIKPFMITNARECSTSCSSLSSSLSLSSPSSWMIRQRQDGQSSCLGLVNHSSKHSWWNTCRHSILLLQVTWSFLRNASRQITQADVFSSSNELMENASSKDTMDPETSPNRSVWLSSHATTRCYIYVCECVKEKDMEHLTVSWWNNSNYVRSYIWRQVDGYNYIHWNAYRHVQGNQHSYLGNEIWFYNSFPTFWIRPPFVALSSL